MRGGGGPNLRISKLLDPVTRQLLAFELCCFFGGYTRTIWMDGRPHPSEYAEHTWDGFSTGEWVGSALKVTTTHMKWGVIQRNGVPASPYATMVEFWTRHGNHLGVFQWVDDPIYLEEPFVRTTDWLSNPGQNLANPVPFDTVDELGDKPLGWVPSFPMGTVHRDLADQFKIPFEATQGGKATIYPEYHARHRADAVRPTQPLDSPNPPMSSLLRSRSSRALPSQDARRVGDDIVHVIHESQLHGHALSRRQTRLEARCTGSGPAASACVSSPALKTVTFGSRLSSTSEIGPAIVAAELLVSVTVCS